MLALIFTRRIRPTTFVIAAAFVVLPGILPAAAPRGSACSPPSFPWVSHLPGCVIGRTTLPASIPGNTVFHVAPTIDGVPLPLDADGTLVDWVDLPSPRTITTVCGQTTLSLESDEDAPDAASITAATNHPVSEPRGIACRAEARCGGVDTFIVEVISGHDQFTPDTNLTYRIFTGDDAATVGGPDDSPVAETVASYGSLAGQGLLDTFVAVRVVDFAGHVSALSNVVRVRR